MHITDSKSLMSDFYIIQVRPLKRSAAEWIQHIPVVIGEGQRWQRLTKATNDSGGRGVKIEGVGKQLVKTRLDLFFCE